VSLFQKHYGGYSSSATFYLNYYSNFIFIFSKFDKMVIKFQLDHIKK